MSAKRTYRLKTVLRALTLTRVFPLVLLQIVFRPVAPPVVRLKSETTVENAGRWNVVVNQYSPGRVASITIEMSGRYRFDYLVTRQGKVDEPRLMDPAGKTEVFNF